LIIGVFFYYISVGHVSEDDVGLLMANANAYMKIFYIFKYIFILFIIKVTLKFLIKKVFKWKIYAIRSCIKLPCGTPEERSMVDTNILIKEIFVD